MRNLPVLIISIIATVAAFTVTRAIGYGVLSAAKNSQTIHTSDTIIGVLWIFPVMFALICGLLCYWILSQFK